MELNTRMGTNSSCESRRGVPSQFVFAPRTSEYTTSMCRSTAKSAPKPIGTGCCSRRSRWRGDCTLSDYGIGEGSSVEIPSRLCGGMPAKGDTRNGDATMTPAESAHNVAVAPNSSLLAWAKWVQGPYQALLKSVHLEQQVDEWERGFLEALTEQEVPEGAVAAMTTRAGLAPDMEEATCAMAAYKGGRHLQPNFIAGVFFRVHSKAAYESTTAPGPWAGPVQPHPTVLQWAR